MSRIRVNQKDLIYYIGESIFWLTVVGCATFNLSSATLEIASIYKQSKVKDSPIRYRPDIDEVMTVPDDEELEINEE